MREELFDGRLIPIEKGLDCTPTGEPDVGDGCVRPCVLAVEKVLRWVLAVEKVRRCVLALERVLGCVTPVDVFPGWMLAEETVRA